jgi:aryl-alcohol dehydrogenase-like predicted oxidoreductase
MDYRRLGRTGLRVSPLRLGTMNFGPQTSEEDSHVVKDAAHDAGINFFDTSGVATGYRVSQSLHRPEIQARQGMGTAPIQVRAQRVCHQTT